MFSTDVFPPLGISVSKIQIYPVGLDSLQDPSYRRFRRSLQDESIQQGQMETHTNEYKIQAIPIRWVTMVIFAWVTL